jgi:hypothetical protein
MSQIPPQPGGWVDAYGNLQPGYPPAGFWPASDGRWYPPQAVPGLPYSGNQKASRTWLWVLLGVVSFVFVGCSSLLAIGLFLDQTSTTTTSQSGAKPFLSTDTIDRSLTGEGDSDIKGCIRVDDDTIEVDLTNSSKKTTSYFLTVAYLDGSGQRLADSLEFVNFLRPGQHAVEQLYVFETQGTRCEVIDVERVDDESDQSHLAEVSACEVKGPDTIGGLVATVSATNSTSEKSDYDVTVAILDGAGIRRSTGFTYIETVRPGETAPVEVFASVDHQPGYTCEVVGVIRSASS